MKRNSIYVDFKNEKQVKWWNNIASRLVKVDFYNKIIETDTNKPVGVLFALKNGLFTNYVIHHNNKFLKNPTTVVIDKTEKII